MMGIEIHIRSIYNWVLGDGSEGKKKKKKNQLLQIPNTHRIFMDGHAISCNPRAVRGGKRTVRSLSPGN